MKSEKHMKVTHTQQGGQKRIISFEGMGLRKPKEVSKEIQEIESDSRLNEAKY